ncbi:hypothetical protein BD770DRAFT_384846 [Pilaira anomala]|nr:hypothetical protein BD770DRAFT_384846 [Pilaira anomala]
MINQNSATTLDKVKSYKTLLLSTRSTPTEESAKEDQPELQPPGTTMVVLNEMESPTMTFTPDSSRNLDPPPDDHVLYCGPCNRKFSRRDNYRQHRKMVHKKELASCIKISLPAIVLPDENDPNFHCRACKKTYSRWYTYRAHLQRTHEMALAPAPSPSKIFLLPNQRLNYPFICCQNCNKQFKSKCGYLQHLRRIHKITISAPNPHLSPDENDPDFYCKACGITSISKFAYLYHLKKTHNMNLRKRGYTYRTH